MEEKDGGQEWSCKPQGGPPTFQMTSSLLFLETLVLICTGFPARPSGGKKKKNILSVNRDTFRVGFPDHGLS